MYLGTHQKTNCKNEIAIFLDNTKLERVKQTKFLGVLIDENLSWRNHIDNLSKKMTKNIGVLNET